MDDNKKYIKFIRILIFFTGTGSIVYLAIFLILFSKSINIPLVIIFMGFSTQAAVLLFESIFNKSKLNKAELFQKASGLIIIFYFLIIYLIYIFSMLIGLSSTFLTIYLIIIQVFMFSLTKFIVAIINKDNAMFYRIWLATEALLTLTLSIIVTVFAILGQGTSILLLVVMILLCGSSNMLYSLIWKKNESNLLFTNT
ncbi:MAG: hypothetical protein ACFFAN_17725 [Promethearchaeota archaeon]